jgi:glycosyltransferase involved in cell wall biosynthesis
VEHLGLLDRPQVAQLLARAKIGMVLLHPTANYLNAQPVKLFEYMSVGLPVIASDFPLWRGIVESAGCGLLVDPLDPVTIARALVWLLRHPAEAREMGRNGERAVAEKYNWERESESLVSAYAHLESSRR